MDNKIVTFESILFENLRKAGFTNSEIHEGICEVPQYITVDSAIEFAKLHVKAALKEVYTNGKIELAKDWIRKTENIYPGSLVYPITIKLHEDSILNAYPLDQIK